MIDHEPCGKRHANEHLVAKCEARLEAKSADDERRRGNAELIPYEEKIRDQMGAHGIAADKVAAVMKRDYPPPPAHLVRAVDGWTTWSVVEVYASQLDWGWMA